MGWGGRRGGVEEENVVRPERGRESQGGLGVPGRVSKGVRELHRVGYRGIQVGFSLGYEGFYMGEGVGMGFRLGPVKGTGCLMGV